MTDKSQAFTEGKAIGTGAAARLIEHTVQTASESIQTMFRGVFAELEDQLGERAVLGWNEADLQEFERGIVAGFGEKAEQYRNYAVSIVPPMAGLH